MRSSAAQRKLDKAQNAYEREVFKIAAEMRARYVVPFCQKHNLHFVTGMGTWIFFSKGRKRFCVSDVWDLDTKRIPKRVLAALTALDISGHDIGSLMQDYVPRWAKQRNAEIAAEREARA